MMMLSFFLRHVCFGDEVRSEFCSPLVNTDSVPNNLGGASSRVRELAPLHPGSLESRHTVHFIFHEYWSHTGLFEPALTRIEQADEADTPDRPTKSFAKCQEKLIHLIFLRFLFFSSFLTFLPLREPYQHSSQYDFKWGLIEFEDRFWCP